MDSVKEFKAWSKQKFIAILPFFTKKISNFLDRETIRLYLTLNVKPLYPKKPLGVSAYGKQRRKQHGK